MRLRLFTVGATDATQHVFGPQGGIFGRSLKCDWVLPDPERILSSVHGRVVFENNKFMLIDESTNGIFVAGRSEPLGRGNSIVLTPGTRFSAARLVVEAELLPAEAGHAAPPVAVTASYPPSLPLAAPDAPRNAEHALREREVWGDLWGRNSQDPLSYLDTPAGDIASGQVPGQPNMPSVAAPPVPAPNVLPPLAMPPQTASVPADNPAFPIGDPFAAPFHAAMPAPPSLPVGHVPLTVEPPVAMPVPPAGKLIPDDFDPLSLIAAPRASRMPAPSLPVVPSLSAVQPLPIAQPGALPSIPTPRPPLSPDLMADLAQIDDHRVAVSGAHAGPTDPLDAAGAMRARREERKARLLEKAGRAALPPIPGMPVPAGAAIPTAAPFPAEPMPSPAQPAAPLSGAMAAMLPANAIPSGSLNASQDAVRTLFRGMGFPEAEIPPGGEAAVMQEVGEMVRALSEGLVMLLGARRMVKSEFRMDETQIQPEENNPFKHFKMAELALDELFLTRSGGFQAPAPAAAAAFDDVKAHVMLTMAAMQRAIRLLVERLDPKLIAREEEEGAARIRGLGTRKSKWEIYSELHQRLSGNLDGVTRQIIGEAFAQVQEEQARRMASQFRESKK